MSLTRFVERSVDGEQDFFSRDILAGILRRKWIIAVCIIVPTLLGLAVTMLTPMTWQSSTKILIRYSTSESVFLKGLIPDDRVSISAAASSEIIRSLPTLEEVIRRYDIQESDLYQTTSRVIYSHIASLYHRAFRTEKQLTPDEKLVEIAKRFQDSLVASSTASAVNSRTAPIEVLSNTSVVPQSVKGDELITLTVRAFNRTRVAEMTNGLAQAFIDQYYRISEEDAHRSFEFLSQLADQLEADVRQLEQNPSAAVSPSEGGGPTGIDNGSIARESPEMTTLANELATLEANLGRAQQVYKDGSPEIERQKATIKGIRTLFSGQERLEGAKEALEQTKQRRFQALNTERLYESHLVPISILEPAVTPSPSISAPIIRLLVSGLTGLFIGSAFGLAIAVVLGLLDQRLFTAPEVERSLGLPVVGRLPRFLGLRKTERGLPALGEPAILAADDGLSQLTGRLHAVGMRDNPHVVAIASTSDDDGKSFLSLLLAKAVTRDSDRKVLLIDGDPGRASLSHSFKHSEKPGPRGEAVTDRNLPHTVVRTDDPNIDLMPQVCAADQSVAQYSRWLRQYLEEARGLYDLVILDTPSVILGGRTLVCCGQADTNLLVVKSGTTRKGPIKDFLRGLQEIASPLHGVILNFRGQISASSRLPVGDGRPRGSTFPLEASPR